MPGKGYKAIAIKEELYKEIKEKAGSISISLYLEQVVKGSKKEGSKEVVKEEILEQVVRKVVKEEVKQALKEVLEEKKEREGLNKVVKKEKVVSKQVKPQKKEGTKKPISISTGITKTKELLEIERTETPEEKKERLYGKFDAPAKHEIKKK